MYAQARLLRLKMRRLRDIDIGSIFHGMNCGCPFSRPPLWGSFFPASRPCFPALLFPVFPGRPWVSFFPMWVAFFPMHGMNCGCPSSRPLLPVLLVGVLSPVLSPVGVLSPVSRLWVSFLPVCGCPFSRWLRPLVGVLSPVPLWVSFLPFPFSRFPGRPWVSFFPDVFFSRLFPRPFSLRAAPAP